MRRFALSEHPIDPDVMRPGLRAAMPAAYAELQLWVPADWEGRAVVGMDVECARELAEREAERLIAEALARASGVEAAVVQRLGSLAVGECLAWIGISGPRPEPVQAALGEIVRALGERLPLWKRLGFADGESLWLDGGGARR
ncbi:MAG: molybdenum cofactor biosynthesis protein MoaE [Xanthomonadales bacterium]|nr:molybdenum cofactor biosynthesis protein MoaE [Xanthomonadales bacterium]